MVAQVAPANDSSTENAPVLNPLSKELVIGLVGYAGAGCSKVGEMIEGYLDTEGYQVNYIKMSNLIAKFFQDNAIDLIEKGANEGIQKLERAVELQNKGDEIRSKYGHSAVANLAIKEISRKRGDAPHGDRKIAFILDSIKHNAEVELLREVYDKGFRLVSVHCVRSVRESRLIGDKASGKKYKGADIKKVHEYLDRDEGDGVNKHGQQVRDAFYLGDYFIDNSESSPDAVRLISGIKRFKDLVLGRGLIRPNSDEVGMFHASAAAIQSSCLSRQVGAALTTKSGSLMATGTNDVPKFGGGQYSDGDAEDHRCFKYNFEIKPSSGLEKVIWQGCHNDRRKKLLRTEIANWFASVFSDDLADMIAKPVGLLKAEALAELKKKKRLEIDGYINSNADRFEKMPGIKDIIEYSRAIHAEMSAVLSATRNGLSTEGAHLFCTTFPCHNCARHLVSAGIHKVIYIEPYVKSLASELHGDAIATIESEAIDGVGKQTKMIILPFTGVGPRMYQDYFVKRDELKVKSDGKYISPSGGTPVASVRLRELAQVEAAAANQIPDKA